MRIAIDAMGGDFAPAPNIDGAVAALAQGVEIILIGPKELLKNELAARGSAALPIEICNATQIVAMDESPITACTSKPDSSLCAGINLLKKNEVDAFISAGNSGALVAAAMINLERIKGVRRPAIATVFPTLCDLCVIVDAGANADCKPKHLYQFALMGEAYVKYTFKRRIPRVALLSVGHEEGKGSKLTKETYQLLRNSDLNFVGNIEGSDIIKGEADVIVCDGFVGNIILKFGESIAKAMLELVKQEVNKSFVRKIGASIMKGAFGEVRKKVRYDEVGGAPLLGVNGTIIICHGISNAKAIKNAVGVAATYVEQEVNKHIENSIV